MKYEDLKEDELPTIRRLDFIVRDTDPISSGMLYGALREMSYLNRLYSESGLSEDEKKRFFARVDQSKIKWINDWMKSHNKSPLFSDPTNYNQVGSDYNYYFGLRSRKRFVEEEIEARLNKSGREPVNIEGEYAKMINDEIAKKMKDKIKE